WKIENLNVSGLRVEHAPKFWIGAFRRGRCIFRLHGLLVFLNPIQNVKALISAHERRHDPWDHAEGHKQCGSRQKETGRVRSSRPGAREKQDDQIGRAAKEETLGKDESDRALKLELSSTFGPEDRKRNQA